MDIRNIIDELLNNNIIESKPTEHYRLIGGTVSDLYLLLVSGREYVVKANTQQVIQEEAEFLKIYEHICLFPKLLYIEPTYKYIMYSFIEGSTDYPNEHKKKWLQTLVTKVLNKYQSVSETAGWGWADQPVDSWKNFQLNELAFAKEVIGSHLSTEDHAFVNHLASNSQLKSKQSLLHGDCGVHNFIFDRGELTGVIDPTPVIGDPVYDLVYAFCSSVDDLTRETIESAAMSLGNFEQMPSSILYEQVVIALYIRLETCLIHHPEDLEAYLNAWNYWKKIVQKD